MQLLAISTPSSAGGAFSEKVDSGRGNAPDGGECSGRDGGASEWLSAPRVLWMWGCGGGLRAAGEGTLAGGQLVQIPEGHACAGDGRSASASCLCPAGACSQWNMDRL